MSEQWMKDGVGLAWVVTDAETGKQAGSVPLPSVSGADVSSLGEPIAAAADDRTFVAAEAVTHPGATVKTPGGQSAQGLPVLESVKWYLLRFSPGSADPLRLAPLPLPSSAALGPVNDMALSADGTELAVMYSTDTHVTLRVYSVATGQLRGSWASTVPGLPKGNGNPFAASFARITNLSWVGDATVGFAFTSHPDVRKDIHEEVRTLSIDADDTSLLSASRAVWSLDVPVATYANYGGWDHPDQGCNSPRLSGNGQVVVCGIATYSAASRRLTTTWLAYPVADPARPRVLASVQASIQPVDVPTLSPASTVEWVNPSGTEIIGQWSHQIVTHAGTPNATWSSTGYTAVIGSGTVHLLPTDFGDVPNTAW